MSRREKAMFTRLVRKDGRTYGELKAIHRDLGNLADKLAYDYALGMIESCKQTGDEAGAQRAKQLVNRYERERSALAASPPSGVCPV